MRSMTVEIGGETRELAATYGASREIMDKVGDPLMIAREAAIEAHMASKGIPYTPRWAFTVENVPEIIHIGLKAAKSDMTKAQVEEAVFDLGFDAAQEMAGDYLALIVTAGPKGRKEAPAGE